MNVKTYIARLRAAANALELLHETKSEIQLKPRYWAQSAAGKRKMSRIMKAKWAKRKQNDNNN